MDPTRRRPRDTHALAMFSDPARRACPRIPWAVSACLRCAAEVLGAWSPSARWSSSVPPFSKLVGDSCCFMGIAP
jgi:hypothetical protein